MRDFRLGIHRVQRVPLPNRNVIILIADDRVFELPVGFSERLHKRIDLEFMRLAP